jgi:hypothetical protein
MMSLRDLCKTPPFVSRYCGTLGSNFNPQNTQCIPVVKIFACLELEQNSAFFKGLFNRVMDFFEPRRPIRVESMVPRLNGPTALIKWLSDLTG